MGVNFGNDIAVLPSLQLHLIVWHEAPCRRSIRDDAMTIIGGCRQLAGRTHPLVFRGLQEAPVGQLKNSCRSSPPGTCLLQLALPQPGATTRPCHLQATWPSIGGPQTPLSWNFHHCVWNFRTSTNASMTRASKHHSSTQLASTPLSAVIFLCWLQWWIGLQIIWRSARPKWTHFCWSRRTPEIPGRMWPADGSWRIVPHGRSGSLTNLRAFPALVSTTLWWKTLWRCGRTPRTRSRARRGFEASDRDTVSKRKL